MNMVIVESCERGRIQELPICFEYPLLSQEWVKEVHSC